MLLFIAAELDWDAIRFGLVDEIELTATNYGLIEAENVTLTWTKYWENVEFILPAAGTPSDDSDSLTIDLGDLPANSTISVTLQVNLIWDVPGDSVAERRGDYIFFWPRPGDPSWFTGPRIMVAPYSNPVDGRFVLQLKEVGEGQFQADYLYYYGNQTLLTYVYDESGDISDTVITENAPEPQSRRLILLDEEMHHRRLCGIDLVAGAKAALLSLLKAKFIPGLSGLVLTIGQGMSAQSSESEFKL